MWNHFDNHDGRTNNRVEGDNTKMKNFCGASDPKMDKAVGLLQNYETTAHDKYQNAKKENARAPAQKPQDVERETKFRQLRKWYRDGKITFAHYHEEILELHQFEPKKKYVEELEDTDESDPPSISDDSDAEIEENDETILEPANRLEQVESASTTNDSVNLANQIDIDEGFLRSIEDTGIRFRNISCEDQVLTTLQPITTINAPQSTLFVDVPRTLDETIQIPLQVSTRTLYSSSSQSSINSNTEIDPDRVPCDLCLKTF